MKVKLTKFTSARVVKVNILDLSASKIIVPVSLALMVMSLLVEIPFTT